MCVPFSKMQVKHMLNQLDEYILQNKSRIVDSYIVKKGSFMKRIIERLL